MVMNGIDHSSCQWAKENCVIMDLRFEKMSPGQYWTYRLSWNIEYIISVLKFGPGTPEYFSHIRGMCNTGIFKTFPAHINF